MLGQHHCCWCLSWHLDPITYNTPTHINSCHGAMSALMDVVMLTECSNEYYVAMSILIDVIVHAFKRHCEPLLCVASITPLQNWADLLFILGWPCALSAKAKPYWRLAFLHFGQDPRHHSHWKAWLYKVLAKYQPKLMRSPTDQSNESLSTSTSSCPRQHILDGPAVHPESHRPLQQALMLSNHLGNLAAAATDDWHISWNV